MKKILKWLIILSNVIILYIAIRWWTPENWHEPLIVIIGQAISLLTLGSEQAASIVSKNIRNRSRVRLNVTSNTNVHTEDIDDSEVDVNNK